MTLVARSSGQVEVHLENGGHVVVSFTDAEIVEREPGVDLVTTLIRAGPSEAELAQAIVDEACRSGMDCRVSSTPGATVVEVGLAEDRSAE
jgi:hypothetical protein